MLLFVRQFLLYLDLTLNLIMITFSGELPWCGEIPVITEAQFYLGYAISAVSFPYCTAICQAIFSKVNNKYIKFHGILFIELGENDN